MKQIKAYLARFGLGDPIASCPIHHPPSGDQVKPYLTVTAKGLYVISADSGVANWVCDLNQECRPELTVSEENAVLSCGENAFVIALKNVSQASLILNVALLLSSGKSLRRFSLRNRYVEKLNTAATLRLSQLLQEKEVLLVFMRCRSKKLAPPESKLFFLMTNLRKRLIVLAPDGSGEDLEMPASAFQLSGSFGARKLTCGSLRWSSRRSNGGYFAEIAEASGLPAPDRLTAIARLNWKYGSKKEKRIALFLLEKALEHGCADAALILHLGLAGRVIVDPSQSLENLLKQRQESTSDSEGLARLCLEWEANPEQEHLLLQAGLKQMGEHWILPFYRHVYSRARAAEKEVGSQIERDLIFSDFLSDLGCFDEAFRILDAAHQLLPSGHQLSLAQDQELPSPQLALKRKIIMMQARTRVKAGHSCAPEIRKAGGLTPLQLPYLQEFLGMAHGNRRLETVCNLLKPGGLVLNNAHPETVWRETGRVDKYDLENRIQHPIAREGGLMGKLQGMLARAEIPDASALRQFCERLNNQPEILAVMRHAAAFLDMEAPEVFISRGDKDVGIRSFEGKPSFVLIGGEHLNPQSRFSLSSGELRFGLASELAHIKYGHTRATPADIREGVLDKGFAVVGGIVSMLPFLSKAGKLMAGSGRLAAALKSLSIEKLHKVTDTAGSARTWAKKMKRAPKKQDERATFITAVGEELVEAARVMQLTADRAGLLFCGDLKSAVRYMFLARPDYQTELALVEEKGLEVLAARCSDDGVTSYDNLLLRIAWLLHFYLSEEYEKDEAE